MDYMAKKQRQFKVIIEQDEDGFFVASVPSLPGCHTQAKDLSKLRKRLKEAISLCLEMADSDTQYKKRLRNFAYEPSFVGLETVKV